MEAFSRAGLDCTFLYSSREDDGNSDLTDSPFLKRIHITIDEDESENTAKVAHCHAKIADQKPVRAHLYREMEMHTDEMSETAFTIFDRWGCLKAILQHHAVKRATGIWGLELDTGKLLLSGETGVEPEYRRRGY